MESWDDRHQLSQCEVIEEPLHHYIMTVQGAQLKGGLERRACPHEINDQCQIHSCKIGRTLNGLSTPCGPCQGSHTG